MTAKSLKWTLAALIVGSPAAMALGLGDIHLHSSLNAPLDADIDLVGATADDLASLRAQVASRETFRKNGLDWPPFLSTVTLQPMHTSDGRDILKVHSGVAITEPFVTLLVEINWARGQVSHEYTVLLDPPVYTPDQGQAAAPVAAPAVGASTRGGTIQREPAAPQPNAAPASPQPAPPAASPAPASFGQTYHVQRGDSLSRIATHEVTTTSRSDVRRWMVATYEGNPDSFDKNMNILRAGSVLRLPDAAALGAVSTRDALAEVRRQYAAWHTGATPAASAATPAGNTDAGRLHLVTPGTAAGSAAAGSAAAGADTRALQGKIQQLQAQLDESQRLLSVRNADLAKLQAQLLAAQAATRSAAATVPPPSAPAPAAAPEVASAPAEAAQSSAASEAPAPAPVAADSGATASAPPVRHHPHVIPVPVEQSSSIMDMLLKYWWALAALIVAIAAWFGLRAWRERRQSSFDDSLGHLNSSPDSGRGGGRGSGFDTQPVVALRPESMVVEESGSHIKPRFDGGASTRAAPHIAGDQTISAETPVNLDQGDPLAEADFHMAYGLYDQAADLVRIAIARDPTRRDLKLKLLEVFFVWGNKEQFLHSAHELASTRAEAAPGEWEKVLIMGKQLAPEDPLFAAGTAVSGAAAAGVDLDLEGGQSTDIDFDVLGSPSAVARAADDIDLDIGTAIGERDATAQTAAAMATDKNLALHTGTVAVGDGTGSTQEMTVGRMAAARFGGLNEGVTQESPTIEQPLPGANGTSTVRQKVEKVLQQNAHVDQTAELAIDDLGLDLNSLDTVDQPALGAGADAPTMVAGLDERSRRMLETAELRRPGFGADPAETPTGSWQFDGVETDAPISIEGAEREHDIGATASLAALSSELDFNIGVAEPEPAAQANGHQGLDLDVGTATVPDAAFAQTQRLGTEDLALPDLEPVTMSEVGTKLDLARAYMDMGDPEGARNILEEVVTEGSVAQKQEAQRLIESLPG
jgi:pilus assembly protein FimV